MSRGFRIGLALVLVVGVAGATLTLAGRGPRQGSRRGLCVLSGVADELNVSTEQRDRIRDIINRHWSGSLGEATQAMHQTRSDLHRLVASPGASVADIQQAVKNSTAAAERVALEKHALVLEIRGVLSPEQQAKADTFLEQADRWSPGCGIGSGSRGPGRGSGRGQGRSGRGLGLLL